MIDRRRHFSRKLRSFWVLLLMFHATSCAQPSMSGDPAALVAEMERLTTEVEQLRASGVELPMGRLRAASQAFEAARARNDVKRMRNLLGRVESALEAYRPNAPEAAQLPPPGAVSMDPVEQVRDLVNFKSGTPGPGSEGYIGLGYTWPDLGKPFVGVGADYVKTVLVSWGKIEPQAPVGGRERYDWAQLDAHVREYQALGFQMQLVLKSSNPWAVPVSNTTEGFVAPGKGSISALPSVPFQAGYARFIASIVERYDGDGYRDMPGLKFPLIYWEIESEAFHEGYWRGTVEDYGKLLEIAYKSAKAASPDSRIILAGLNFSDVFDDAPSEAELASRFSKLGGFAKKGLRFMQESLQFAEHYDAIEIHYNRDYRGLPGILNWLRSELGDAVYARKEIWAGDTLTTPWLFTPSRQVKPPFPEDRIYQDIKAGLGARSKAESWFRAEQSRLMVKKLVMGAEQGLARMILLMMKDRPQGVETPVDKNWMISGLLDRSLQPRPAYHALRQISPYFKGSPTVTRVRHSDPQTYIYKFTYPKQRWPVFVAWSESENTVLNLRNFELPAAMVESVITGWSSAPSTLALESRLSLTSTPVIVRAK